MQTERCPMPTGLHPLREAIIRRSPEAGELRRRLLAIGGNRVCLQVPDLDLPALLSRGRDFPTEGVRRRRLERNQCHRNVATLWCNAPGRVRIATGYALSDDGLWRQHSWAVKGGRVIETTERRTAYHGITLTLEEALAFTMSNPPEFLLAWSGEARAELRSHLLAALKRDEVNTVKQWLRARGQGRHVT